MQVGFFAPTCCSQCAPSSMEWTKKGFVLLHLVDKVSVFSSPSMLQVGFFRPNLLFSVRPKQYGVDEEGRPQPLSSLVDYIQDQNDLAQVGCIISHIVDACGLHPRPGRPGSGGFG